MNRTLETTDEGPPIRKDFHPTFSPFVLISNLIITINEYNNKIHDSGGITVFCFNVV